MPRIARCFCGRLAPKQWGGHGGSTRAKSSRTELARPEPALGEVASGSFVARRFRIDRLWGRDPNLARLPGARKLCSVGDSLDWCWSPDGRRLALTKRYASGLALLDVETGAETELFATRSAFHPLWSPDGRHIAWTVFGSAVPSSDRGVWIGDARGGEPWRVLNDGTATGWSPDGKALWVLRTRPREVLEVRVDEPDLPPRKILDVQERGCLSLSPGGERILWGDRGACVVRERETDLEVVRWAAGGTLPAWSDFSPDGRFFAAVAGSGLEADRGLWVVRIPEGEAYPVSTGRYFSSAWAPDGSRFSLARESPAGQGTEIWAFDARAIGDLRATRLGDIAPR